MSAPGTLEPATLVLACQAQVALLLPCYAADAQPEAVSRGSWALAGAVLLLRQARDGLTGTHQVHAAEALEVLLAADNHGCVVGDAASRGVARVLLTAAVRLLAGLGSALVDAEEADA